MNYEKRYGILSRLLYRTAFRTNKVQHMLSDLEESVFQNKLKGVKADDPVFISGLPRSGTTILLRLLWKTDEFATHTYQDMPFVLCPLFWNWYSSFFSKDIGSRERTHGDGIEISGKSPEAFEEVVWKYFWPNHYRESKIQPWESGEQDQEFRDFFETHMQKIIAIRKDCISKEGRYLSKNNLNISRLASLPAPFKKGTFLIPFRHPLQQAASMLRQHRRLLEIQEENDFVREYMEAIGHHEFGKTLKPVNFNGWLDDSADPDELIFWVQYWVAAYRFVVNQAGDSTVLVSYERLFKQPKASLSKLENILGLNQNELASKHDSLHPPRSHSVERGELPDSLLQKSAKLYEKLSQKATV